MNSLLLWIIIFVQKPSFTARWWDNFCISWWWLNGYIGDILLWIQDRFLRCLSVCGPPGNREMSMMDGHMLLVLQTPDPENPKYKMLSQWGALYEKNILGKSFSGQCSKNGSRTGAPNLCVWCKGKSLRWWEGRGDSKILNYHTPMKMST